MKTVFWATILAIFIIWFLFSKIWLKDESTQFIFSDREKYMVFPTIKPVSIDPYMPATASTSPVINKQNNGTDSSLIRY